MKQPLWNRRTLLKASLLTVAALACGKRTWGNFPILAERDPFELSLYNIHTGEELTASYRDASGCPLPDSLAAFDRLLRCHYSGEIHPIDIDTLDYLAMVDAKLGSCNRFHIVSGYRSPTYNELLRQKGGGGVAANSLHLVGMALDIRLPARPLDDLHRSALNLQCGGVGLYPKDNFVHIDCGPSRSWLS